VSATGARCGYCAGALTQLTTAQVIEFEANFQPPGAWLTRLPDKCPVTRLHWSRKLFQLSEHEALALATVETAYENGLTGLGFGAVQRLGVATAFAGLFAGHTVDSTTRCIYCGRQLLRTGGIYASCVNGHLSNR